MLRLLPMAAVAAATLAACSTPFREKRTPSGEFCSDMQVVPAGQVPDREYHRLQPIASDPESRTEAERLESLRKAACSVGGDAVIEAVNEEVRTEDGRYASVASGTAVIWIRLTTGEAKPLTVHPSAAPPVQSAPAEPEAPPPPPPTDVYDEPAPVASGKPPAPGASAKPGSPAKPSSPPAPSAKPPTPFTPSSPKTPSPASSTKLPAKK